MTHPVLGDEEKRRDQARNTGQKRRNSRISNGNQRIAKDARKYGNHAADSRHGPKNVTERQAGHFQPTQMILGNHPRLKHAVQQRGAQAATDPAND